MKKIYFFVVLLFFYTCALWAQEPSDSSYLRTHYSKYEYMIPMRDGVKLYTAVYVPRDTTKLYPIMMERSCYGSGPSGYNQYPNHLGPSPEFEKEGFIFVYQDVRGKHKSEGKWVEIKPFIEHKVGVQIDEASDTYDAVDFLIKTLPHNNGKVGVWGISYPGFFATNAALSAHPAIKAVSPQAPVTNWFLGDDTHHNGAFFLMDEFDFDYWFASSTNGSHKDFMPDLNLNYSDNYNFFLKLGSVRDVNIKYYHHLVPFWDTILMHPNYDSWWKARDIRRFMHDVKPAMLLVGGWYDAEDLWGTLQTYEKVEEKNKNIFNHLVMGPWNHGGWSDPNMNSLGDLTFGTNTSRWFQRNIEFPFFMHFLKGSPMPLFPKALLYDPGLNKWLSFEQWPSASLKLHRFYFSENKQIEENKPSSLSAYDAYTSDPETPVPYEGGIHAERGISYMNADQRFASRRPDVLSFSTPVLDSDLTLGGPIKADLWVSVSGTDADFVVKIIDVYPDSMQSYILDGKEIPIGGYQALVRWDVMRGKYRNSFEHPEPFSPGKPTEVCFKLPDFLYTFKKGHRLMFQIQSSIFPLVDRNPQIFTDIYTAPVSLFRKASIRIYRDKFHPSYLEMGRLSSDLIKLYQVPEVE